VGIFGTILKTMNGGATWNALSSGTNNFLWSVYFLDADTGYVAGDGGIILKTTDSGATWIAQLSGTTNSLSSVYFPTADIGYAAGDGGTILKTGGSTGLLDLQVKQGSLEIYPNPSSCFITVNASEIPVKGQLSIMNMNGQQLITTQITGPKIQINISDLPCGIYTLRLTNEKTTQVGKVIKK
jgi:hypothetical protein